MKTFALAALFAVSAAPALAVPFCYAPKGDGSFINFHIEIGDLSEADRAKFYEMELNARGIEAANTRFWNGCVQTFVTENGHFTMRFYDPWTLEEIPVG
jgi:hypothetical protein